MKIKLESGTGYQEELKDLSDQQIIHVYNAVTAHMDARRIKVGQHETVVFWMALHNPNIHESSAYTISLHKTKEGAKKAVEESKREVKKEYNEVYDESDDIAPEWDRFHWWGIKKQEVSTK